MKILVKMSILVIILITLFSHIPVSAFNPIAMKGLNDEEKYEILNTYTIILPTDGEYRGIDLPILTNSYWNSGTGSSNFEFTNETSPIKQAYKLLIGTDQLKYNQGRQLTSTGELEPTTYEWIKNNGGFSVLVGYYLGTQEYEIVFTYDIYGEENFKKLFEKEGYIAYSSSDGNGHYKVSGPITDGNLYGLTSPRVYGNCLDNYKTNGYNTPYDMWKAEMQPLRDYIDYQWAMIDKKITKRFKNYDKNDKADKKYTLELKKKYGITFTFTKNGKTFTTPYKNFMYYDINTFTFTNTLYKSDEWLGSQNGISESNKLGQLAGIYTLKSDNKCKKIKMSTLKKSGMPKEYRDKLEKGFALINKEVDRICDTSMNKQMYQQFDRSLDELEAFKIEMYSFLNETDSIAKYYLDLDGYIYEKYKNPTVWD